MRITLILTAIILTGCAANDLPVPVGDGLYYCEGCAVLVPDECRQGGEGWHIGGKAAAC